MKSLTQFIKESLNNVLLSYYDGHNNQMLFSTVEAARAFIKSVPDVKYYDITKGSNASEESNLIEWFGTDGYWYNVCYQPVLKQDRRELAQAERAKNKEVKKL